MQPRYPRETSCDGKVRHASAERGWRQIKLLARTHANEGGMTCYHCAYCKGWHIGHARTTSTRREKK